MKLPKKIKNILTSRKKVLDLGCGRGWLANYVKKENYTGLTNNKVHIKYLKKKGYFAVNHTITNTSKLPFADKTFDCVFASHIIEHFDKQEVLNVMSELKRVLSPKGCLILITPTEYGIGFNGNWTHWRPYNHGSLPGILKGHEYEKVDWGYPKIFRFPKVLQRWGRILYPLRGIIWNEVIAYGFKP